MLLIFAIITQVALAKNAGPCEWALYGSLRQSESTNFVIKRERRGKSYVYLNEKTGKPVSAARAEWIDSLKIRKDLTNVRISDDPQGHLQAYGYDGAGRRQDRYHPEWTRLRSTEKFASMVNFGNALPRLRAAVARDLKAKELSKNKVLAALVHLLENTLIRVGNEENVETYKSYGLTTLRKFHLTSLRGNKMRFKFPGKEQVPHDVPYENLEIADLLRELRDIPGENLFQYCAGCSVSSDDVNKYIKQKSGGDFSAKDFRTWYGNVLAIEFLRTNGDSPSAVPDAKKAVAEALHNEPAQSKAYTSPKVYELFEAGELDRIERQARRRNPSRPIAETMALIILAD